MKRILNGLTEDHTSGVLKGIPVFCINRLYKFFVPTVVISESYRFEFANGYGASIVKFTDSAFSGGHDYELAVLDSNGSLTYETYITADVCRGDQFEMNRLLDMVEGLTEAALLEWQIETNSRMGFDLKRIE
jgi:hypothetical protein